MIPKFLDKKHQIKTTTQKHMFRIFNFDYTKLSKILHIPVSTNKIRNKSLNYEDTVNSTYVEDETSFNLNTDPCEC